MKKAEYPDFPRPSCHAAIVDDGRLLLVKRRYPPFAGSWGLPGGSIELGETVEAALQRECLEETNLKIEMGPFIDYLDGITTDDERPRFHYVILFFRARPVGGQLQAASDAADAQWVTPDELAAYNLTPGMNQVLAFFTASD